MYIRLVDGSPEPVTIAQLHAEEPNWSPPKGYPDRVLNKRGVYRVTQTERPSASHVRDGFELVDGVWQTKWRAMTAQEAADALTAKREAMVVTMAQARKALHAVGKLADAEAALQGLSEPEKTNALIDWEYSTTVRRTSPWVQSLAPALSLDDAALDALFESAASL